MACTKEPAGAKPPLAGLLKLQILWQQTVAGALTAANVLHLRWNDSNNHIQSAVSTLGNAVTGYFQSRFLPSVAPHWQITGFVIQSLGGDGVQASGSLTAPGTAGAVAFPPQVSVCVSWQTNITQRGGRGRTYLPGIPSTATNTIDSAVISSAYSVPLHTAANGFITDIEAFTVSGVGSQLVIPSYYSKCQLRPVPLSYPVNNAIIHDRLDSQRRRSGKERNYPIT